MTNLATISLGQRINRPADPLAPIALGEVHAGLLRPSEHVARTIARLRALPADTARKERADLKLRLPYLVCARFNPASRRIANFSATNCLALDFDGFSADPRELAGLARRIVADSRVALAFVSPGGAGLKVFFILTELCRDPAAFSAFHKKFAAEFAAKHSLQGFLDAGTSDVTRACFLSHDPAAYLNPEPVPVEMAGAEPGFLKMAPIQSLERPADDAAAAGDRGPSSKSAPARMETENPAPDGVDDKEPSDAEIEAILESIMPSEKSPEKPRTPVYVPSQLLELRSDLCQSLTEAGLSVDEVVEISYGLKYRLSIASGKVQGEVTVYYGRKGFTVLESSRAGTDTRLNRVGAERIRNFLCDRITESAPYSNLPPGYAPPRDRLVPHSSVPGQSNDEWSQTPCTIEYSKSTAPEQESRFETEDSTSNRETPNHSTYRSTIWVPYSFATRPPTSPEA